MYIFLCSNLSSSNSCNTGTRILVPARKADTLSMTKWNKMHDYHTSENYVVLVVIVMNYVHDAKL